MIVQKQCAIKKESRKRGTRWANYLFPLMQFIKVLKATPWKEKLTYKRIAQTVPSFVISDNFSPVNVN